MYYSDKYYDDEFEYRNVEVPKEIAARVPKTHLMTEPEWRSIGIQQSPGWIHYMMHAPEPHVLMFRRPLTEKAPSQMEQVTQDCAQDCQGWILSVKRDPETQVFRPRPIASNPPPIKQQPYWIQSFADPSIYGSPQL